VHRYQEAKVKREEPTLAELDDLVNDFGTTQVPLVRDMRPNVDPKQRCLRDSTCIIEHLGSNVIPMDPFQRFVAFVMDDFADEYLWRPAMYSRWSPDFDSRSMGMRWTYEFARDDPWYVPMVIRPFVLKWRQKFFSVIGEGIYTEEQHAAVQRQYLEVLDALNTILETSPYLMGEKPSIVDFAFTGPFFRHFYSDPSPRKIMEQRAPNVVEWIGRMWNSKRSKLEAKSWCPPGTLPASWATLWPLVLEFFLYSEANAKAWKEGASSFTFAFRGG